MKRHTRLAAYAALFASRTVWGFSFIALKDAVETIPIFSLLFVRFGLSTVLLGGILAAQGTLRSALRRPKRDLAILAGLSLLAPVGSFIFETHGISLTQPSHVSLIVATIPIAVYAISLLRKKEKFTATRSAGILCAFSGVSLILLTSRHEAGANILGDILILGTVACASLKTSLVKDVLRRISPVEVTFYTFLVSLCVFGPVACAEGFDWVWALTPLHIGEILFLSILCSAVASLCKNYALSRLGATQVAATGSLTPVVALLAEATIMAVPIGWEKGLGTTLVILGVFVTQLKARDQSSSWQQDGEQIVKDTDHFEKGGFRSD
ncbi:DMT family transporter [Candidatus Bipolaricaulota bacterium]